MDNLEEMFKESDWGGFFSTCLQELEQAKEKHDQEKIDLIFRLLRGAVFMLGHEYGETARNNETASINERCSCCGIKKEETKLVGFTNGFLCSKCANLIAMELNNA